jgi:hypothetical protein
MGREVQPADREIVGWRGKPALSLPLHHGRGRASTSTIGQKRHLLEYCSYIGIVAPGVLSNLLPIPSKSGTGVVWVWYSQ